jgi:Sec-independent protein translocase protein TatA
MFGIGFSEIIVIFLVAIIVLDTKKLKEYIQLLKHIYGRINDIKKDFHKYVESLDETLNVVGDDGKVYKAYKLNKVVKKDNDSSNTSSR